MFDIAWSEYLLIAILALVLLGPKELPVVLGTLGRWIAKFRQLSSSFQEQLYNMELEQEYKQSILDASSKVETEPLELPKVFPLPFREACFLPVKLPLLHPPYWS